ncbi:hypothetical protein JCM8547_008370 [Rhodosporidiobolus lusitaniae]
MFSSSSSSPSTSAVLSSSSSSLTLPTAFSSFSKIPRPVWRSLATPRRTLYSSRELSLFLPAPTESSGTSSPPLSRSLPPTILVLTSPFRRYSALHRISFTTTPDNSLDSLLLPEQAAELAAAIQALSLAAAGDSALEGAAAELVAAGQDLLSSAAVEVDFRPSSSSTTILASYALLLLLLAEELVPLFFPLLLPLFGLFHLNPLFHAFLSLNLLLPPRLPPPHASPLPYPSTPSAPPPPPAPPPPSAQTASSSAKKVWRAGKKTVEEQGKRWRF